MSAVATEARDIVRAAAEPIPAGETIKGQMRRAARSLGYRDGDWRIQAAWYGHAGSWSATAFEDLRSRYTTWREKRERIADSAADLSATKFLAMAAMLEQQDESFHREHINQLRDMARRLGRAAQSEIET